MRPCRSLLGLLLALACGALAPPAHAIEAVWSRLPGSLPADSCGPALLRLEAAGPRAAAAGAAYALGQFHMARGEYRLAAAALGRAAGRLEGLDRAEARYRQGLAWLGERDPGRARASFEEVVMLSPPLRPLAQLGLARSFALAGDAAQEMTVLRRLLDGPASEAEPAALERYAALCERAHKDAEAVAARARLLQRWSRSFEAALLEPAPPALLP
jgi:tetratricopeptide (TPR) repeat protein